MKAQTREMSFYQSEGRILKRCFTTRQICMITNLQIVQWWQLFLFLAILCCLPLLFIDLDSQYHNINYYS